MLSVPVYTMNGEPAGEMSVDPAVLGGRVRVKLLKQAVVAYLDHQRQHSARTKSRSDVEGSTRKLYRQKGTGNARAGMIRTPVRRGGGRAFAKRGPRAHKGFPKAMRRLARNSAILAKIESGDALVVADLSFPEPKTKRFVSMLSALKVDGGCVLALHEADRNAYLSGRNLPKTEIKPLAELHAYEILRRRKLILTKPALERLLADPLTCRGEARAESA
ncbi:MAG: 50S ribosomal protein L4 [Planctomycetota bacterium]|nr:MAG: 50S ribosomal protein L4 [Planctomycetota bacterium]